MNNYKSNINKYYLPSMCKQKCKQMKHWIFFDATLSNGAFLRSW